MLEKIGLLRRGNLAGQGLLSDTRRPLSVVRCIEDMGPRVRSQNSESRIQQKTSQN
jgi:hypothetical protein